MPIARCLAHVINPTTRRAVTYKTSAAAFYTEIATALQATNAEVAANLFRIATANNESSPTVQAAIFWLRTKAGWRYANDSTPANQQGNGSEMVGTEENARAIVRNVLAEYGRERLTHREATPLSDE
ncbi:hypothetical protein OKW41_007414 [Paraburkholderia sp. UCT70]|uniref:hypothetical protein n=1 Tax=Paraburkholderia sp. UCT70 TaxID=2991068 RepID=UPI003D1C6D49